MVAHRTILWIDDELDSSDPLVRLLSSHGFEIDVARSGAEGQTRADLRTYDAMILDLRLPDMFGLTLLQRLRARGVAVPVVVATGHYLEPEIKASAMEAGATLFTYKPFLDVEELARTLDALVAGPGRSTVDEEPAASGTEPPFGIVAASPVMQRIIGWIRRLGPADAPVLLTGETGTGKELVARALHQVSARARAPFVAVNCAAIPDDLVETELFGHRKGAFTGAVSDREGVFEAAHRGMLFLDEIGDLPLSVQASLLRCLDSGEIRRVGETKTRTVDVRVVAATNRSLRRDIMDGRFRADLYYRIAVVNAELPPLRQRLDDIDALIAHWLPDASRRWQKRIVGITPGALKLLRSYSWPGNVRELFNVLERSVAVASGELLLERDISEAFQDAAGDDATAIERVPDVERLVAALDQHDWNHTEAARSLGINRTTLWRRLRRLGLIKPNDRR